MEAGPAGPFLPGGDAVAAAEFAWRLRAREGDPPEPEDPMARATARSIIAASRVRAAALRSWLEWGTPGSDLSPAAQACGAEPAYGASGPPDAAPTRRVARALLTQGNEALAFRAPAAGAPASSAADPAPAAGPSAPDALPTETTAQAFAADAAGLPRRLLPQASADAERHKEVPDMAAGSPALAAAYAADLAASRAAFRRPTPQALHALSAIHASDFRTRRRRTKRQRQDDETVETDDVGAAIDAAEFLASRLRRCPAAALAAAASLGFASRHAFPREAALHAFPREAALPTKPAAPPALPALGSAAVSRLPSSVLQLSASQHPAVASTLRRLPRPDLAAARAVALPEGPARGGPDPGEAGGPPAKRSAGALAPPALDPGSLLLPPSLGVGASFLGPGIVTAGPGGGPPSVTMPASLPVSLMLPPAPASARAGSLGSAGPSAGHVRVPMALPRGPMALPAAAPGTLGLAGLSPGRAAAVSRAAAQASPQRAGRLLASLTAQGRGAGGIASLIHAAATDDAAVRDQGGRDG